MMRTVCQAPGFLSAARARVVNIPFPSVNIQGKMQERAHSVNAQPEESASGEKHLAFLYPLICYLY